MFAIIFTIDQVSWELQLMEVYIEFLYVFGIVKYVFNMLLFVSV